MQTSLCCKMRMRIYVIEFRSLRNILAKIPM